MNPTSNDHSPRRARWTLGQRMMVGAMSFIVAGKALGLILQAFGILR